MITIRRISLSEYYIFKASIDHVKVNEDGLLHAVEDFLLDEELVFGAFVESRMVGIISFDEELFEQHDHQVKETLIGVIFVHPDYRHLGVGKELLAYARAQARTPHILVDPIDHEAQSFFLQCGFSTNLLYPNTEGGEWLMITEAGQKEYS